MNTAEKSDTQIIPEHRRARINSWQNKRGIQIYQDKIGLQVTVPSCSHCVTCQRRVREFKETLAKKPLILNQWKILSDGAYWVFLARDKDKNPLNLLKEALEIRIEES